MNKAALLVGAAGLLIGGGAVAVTGLGRPAGDRAATEQVVRDYLLANPEVIPEAMQRLQLKEAAKAVEANRAALERPFGSAWAGAKDGDVVLVEFFDYACGFCRQSNADVDRLLREDPKLKVVWREWPVLGEPSLAAAEASLKAAEAGRFRQFFNALYAQGRPDPQAIAEASRLAGVPAGTSPAPHQRELQSNHELARAIGATGTPTFVIGDQVLQGAVGYEALKAAVAKARSDRA
jgi:protein-disulfide isomerase